MQQYLIFNIEITKINRAMKLAILHSSHPEQLAAHPGSFLHAK